MIPKTISPTDLRKDIYSVVHEVAAKGELYLITPAEGDSVVLCSRAEYNALVAERELLRDLREAEADIAAGRTSSTSDVRAFIAKRGTPARATRLRRSR